MVMSLSYDTTAYFYAPLLCRFCVTWQAIFCIYLQVFLTPWRKVNGSVRYCYSTSVISFYTIDVTFWTGVNVVTSAKVEVMHYAVDAVNLSLSSICHCRHSVCRITANVISRFHWNLALLLCLQIGRICVLLVVMWSWIRNPDHFSTSLTVAELEI